MLLSTGDPRGYPEVMLDRITANPEVCNGKATVRGMRITVEFILKLIGNGQTVEEILRDYPELEREDVLQAARYGAWLAAGQASAMT